MRRGFTGVTAPALCFGYAFLYVPIALLVLYSFNAGRLVTVWSGWSLHWYAVLWQNELLLDSLRITLEVGLLSASGALVLGSLAAWRWPACRVSPAARCSSA
jgi:putrescine transport system permease protein